MRNWVCEIWERDGKHSAARFEAVRALHALTKAMIANPKADHIFVRGLA